MQHKELSIKAPHRGVHLITDDIVKALGPLPDSGMLHLFLRHTSAGIMLNENSDPDVRADFELMMNNIVPEYQRGVRHTMEGPDDMPSHVKSALTGVSLWIPIKNGKLLLGRWQGVYLCEFRNIPVTRNLVLTVCT